MEVVSSADGAAQTIVGMIGQVVVEELRQISGVGDKVVHLRDELATMNALLRMLSEVDEGSVDHLVREWMKQVRELAYDAEDCIDDFRLRINRAVVPPGDGASPLSRARHLVSRGKRQFDVLLLRRSLADKIHDLLARTVTVSERRVRYGVDRKALRISDAFVPVSAASASASAHALRPTNDPGHFVGIEDQVGDLAEKARSVTDAGDDMNKLRVLSVVGFGGLGKTTLAVQVCRRLEDAFERQAVVSVSQAFDGNRDMKGLLKRILQQLVKAKTSNEKGFMEEEAVGDIDKEDDELAQILKQRLRDKRYLIVINDVWTIAAWNAIRFRLPDNDCGSRIIVTTRIETVAKACSPEDSIHRIKPLKQEDSKKLFVNRVFGPNASCPDQLEPTMKTILEKCGGLPLAIVSIASLLASYKSANNIDMWKRICKSIGSQMEINPTLEGMRQIITLSYNHLPHHLKGCMMYLSIFPEDYVVDKNRLLYRWIAEGLVIKKRGLTLLEVAEAYFDELISRNMIEPANISYDGRAEACQVHDMMLEVVVSKSLEANFLTLVGGQTGGISYDKIRRLSIHGEDRGLLVKQRAKDSTPEKMPEEHGTSRKHGVEAMNLDHVRSLSTFQPEGHRLLDHLDKFPLLRVLDLEDCMAVKDDHMKHVCRLFLLKFWSLKGTDITRMPREICELEHLQMLNLWDTCLKELPDTVINLEKLEFLYFSNKKIWDAVWKLPRGLKRMKALGVAYKVDLIDDVEIAKELGELSQLRELCIILSTTNKSVLQELARAMGRMYSLRWLNIVEHHEDDTTKLNFLLDLPSPPLLLRFLRIGGVVDKLPDWVKSLAHLTYINLSATKLRIDQLLGVLCELPSLMDIVLWRDSYTDSELVARAAYRFPMLKKLSIVSDYDEHKVIKFEEGSMETLETLEYRFDDREKRLIGIEHLKNLKEVKLFGNINKNPALIRTVEELKVESSRRPEGQQFNVAVKKD